MAFPVRRVQNGMLAVAAWWKRRHTSKAGETWLVRLRFNRCPVTPSAPRSALQFTFYFAGRRVTTAPAKTRTFSGKGLLIARQLEALETPTSCAARFWTPFLALVAAAYSSMILKWCGFTARRTGRKVTKAPARTCAW